MILVIDNFFPDDVFQRVYDEIKSCDFIPISSKMKSEGVDYPGARTRELKDIDTQFDRFKLLEPSCIGTVIPSYSSIISFGRPLVSEPNRNESWL